MPWLGLEPRVPHAIMTKEKKLTPKQIPLILLQLSAPNYLMLLSRILVTRQEINRLRVRWRALLDKLLTITTAVAQKERLPQDATWLVRRFSNFAFTPLFCIQLIFSFRYSLSSYFCWSLLLPALLCSILFCSSLLNSWLLFCLRNSPLTSALRLTSVCNSDLFNNCLAYRLGNTESNS
jgi:hypothetical protein